MKRLVVITSNIYDTVCFLQPVIRNGMVYMNRVLLHVICCADVHHGLNPQKLRLVLLTKRSVSTQGEF